MIMQMNNFNTQKINSVHVWAPKNTSNLKTFF